jgi:phosphate starvation-inducible PhoH-like protein
MNDKQKDLQEALKYNTIVVAQGSAGVGKTLLACYHAAKKLHYGDIKKIILIRAYQPLAGRTIGMLPGDSDQKLLPFYQQMIDYFEDFLGKATTEIHIKNKTIEICSLETIRGRSWSDAIIIVDESQSLFVPEVQALTTRIGENAQMIFCGDNTGNQTDVKNGMDGLTYLNKIVQKYNIPDCQFITFTRDQICRSDVVRDFVIAFEEEMIADEKGLETVVSRADVDKQFRKGR